MDQNYDVFFSHNSVDKPTVEQIADRLREEHGLKIWLDKWELRPGLPTNTATDFEASIPFLQEVVRA